VLIATQLASGNSTLHERSRSAIVFEKRAAGEGLVSGLIRHLLPAAGKGEN
jgi:hypothetical protein